MSYAALAGILAIAILIGLSGSDGHVRGASPRSRCWSGAGSRTCLSTTSSPSRSRSLAIMVATALRGAATADLLVGGLVLAGALMPVVRPDTNRAIRDFGLAAVGLIILSVMLAHGVALAAERGESGVLLVAAVCLGCAGSDVGAFIVGKRFGSVPLAPSLSPNKTREGLIGNILGAAVGIAILAPGPVVGRRTAPVRRPGRDRRVGVRLGRSPRIRREARVRGQGCRQLGCPASAGSSTASIRSCSRCR